MQTETIRQGKALAIVAYITFIGLIIATIMNLEKRNPFTSFHIRQMMGLLLLLLFSQLVEQHVNSLLGTALWVLSFVGWLLGLVAAIKGSYQPIPLLGEKFQDWFKNML